MFIWMLINVLGKCVSSCLMQDYVSDLNSPTICSNVFWHFIKKQHNSLLGDQTGGEQTLFDWGLNDISNLCVFVFCFFSSVRCSLTDFGQTGAEVQAGFDSFLSLASVTEPDSDHLLLQMEAFGYPGYFLRRWLTFFNKAALQSLLSSQAAVGKQGEERRRWTVWN